MSRCFPYPPPGYKLSRAYNEPLIESIKLQNEMVKSKREHKERVKTKDKEQRKKDRKEKKGKKKEEDKTKQSLQKSDGVLGKIGEKLWASTKSKVLPKGCKAESEQLERSVVTEEHGHPVGSNTLSYSSDSTENSNKRKRQFSPEEVNLTNGKIIRIKLSKKPDDSGATAYERHVCSTSGSPYLPFQHTEHAGLANKEESPCSTSNRPGNLSQGFNQGKIHVMSQQIKTTIPIGKTQVPSPRSIVMIPPTTKQIKTTPIGKAAIPPPKSLFMTPMQKMELHYNSLFEKLAPPSMQNASFPDDDLGWLFNSKKQDRNTERKPISDIASMSCSSDPTLWPRAQYLQEVEVYALPFTVPF